MNPKIQTIVDEALARAKKALHVEDVSVVVEEKPQKVIPETGVGGYTPDSHTIYIYIDPHHPNLKTNLAKELVSTVTHEAHHAVRNRTVNWKTDTLRGALVTEGLADHFDLELNGGDPRPWAVALSEEELRRVEDMAEKEFDNTRYDHAAWFFGSSGHDIPRWAGYALGFKMVGDYLQKTGKKASELVSDPATLFT